MAPSCTLGLQAGYTHETFKAHGKLGSCMAPSPKSCMLGLQDTPMRHSRLMARVLQDWILQDALRHPCQTLRDSLKILQAFLVGIDVHVHIM